MAWGEGEEERDPEENRVVDLEMGEVAAEAGEGGGRV